ncbi:MAG: AAA family ATPase [Candidatus Kerfeldbacteria bacterium]
MANKVIIIRGPLGVGKSTISTQLATMLSGLYIPLDDVLDRLGLDRVPPDAECIPAQNFLTALKSVLPQLKLAMAQGKSAVIDACFYHKEMIEYLESHFPGKTAVFTLDAPIDVCITRDRNRSKNHGEDAARAVYSLVSRFSAGVRIDATQPKEAIIEKILAFLK